MDNLPKKVDTNKERGTAGELIFCMESYRRGLQPHTMIIGDPACHDVIVIHGKTGKPRIVQVRTSDFSYSGRSGTELKYSTSKRWQVKAMCKNDTIHLRDTNVQALAAYCPEFKLWYIIPVSRIKSKSCNLYPHTSNSKGQYEKFKENWAYFGFSSGDPVLLS